MDIFSELYDLFNEKYLLNIVKNFFQDLEEGQLFELCGHTKIITLRLLRYFEKKNYNVTYNISIFWDFVDDIYLVYIKKSKNGNFIGTYSSSVEKYGKDYDIMLEIDNTSFIICVNKERFTNQLVRIIVSNKFKAKKYYFTRKIE